MPKTWTKADEVAWLKRAIAHLGPNSYLGPWLAENAGRIEQDLLSDFAPTPLPPGEAYRQGTEMLAETKKECDAMLQAAAKTRTTMLEDARRSVEDYKARARAELRGLADRLS